MNKGAKAAIAEVPEKARPDFQSRYDALDKECKAAIEQYKKDKDSVRFAQIISNAANAVTQLLAGAYGLKHGVDLSHIRGAEWNWKEEFDGILQEMKAKQENVKEKRAITSKEESELAAEDRADKRLAAQEKATDARFASQRAHEKFLADEAEKNRRAAEERQEGKIASAERIADAKERRAIYQAQGHNLVKAADEVFNPNNPKAKMEYSKEEAQALLKGIPGMDQEVVLDSTHWFTSNKVSAAQLSNKFRSLANRYYEMGAASPTATASSVPAEYTAAYRQKYPNATDAQIAQAWSKESK